MATEWNFNFKAEPQPITLKAGRYKLECWGACGGKKGVTAGNGGLGGYAKGELTLKKKLFLMFMLVNRAEMVLMRGLYLMVVVLVEFQLVVVLLI